MEPHWEGEDELHIIDAHQHFWDLGSSRYPWLCSDQPIPFRYGDYSPIRRNYLPSDYRKDAGGLPIVKTVHIEAEFDPADPLGETAWLEQLAEKEGFPSAIVAQAWLDRDDAEEVLAAQASRPLVRGIRHKPRYATAPEQARRGLPGSMDCPRWRDGYALLHRHGLSFDLQTPWWHLDAAAELAADFPQTRIIINHTALPADRSPEGLAAWRQALEQVADRPNVAIKISGLGRAGQPWTLEANGPIVKETIAVFGVERCLFASNFPVDSLVGNLVGIFTGFRAAVADRPLADQQALFHDNAARIYRL